MAGNRFSHHRANRFSDSLACLKKKKKEHGIKITKVLCCCLFCDEGTKAQHEYYVCCVCLCLEVFRTGRASGLSMLSVHHKHAHRGCLKSPAPAEVWCVRTFRWERFWNPRVSSITGFCIVNSHWTLVWSVSMMSPGIAEFCFLPLWEKFMSQFC